MPEIISRKEAKARGLKRYFTGKPCKHGHASERFTPSKGCRECQRLTNKNWGHSNPDKRREKDRNYRTKNREKRNAFVSKRLHKIADLLAVLRKEMPELLKEFDL